MKIFDDRIEFYNPGELYGGVSIEDLLSNNYTSKSRNKLVAKALKEIGLIERYGSGIKRILNICYDYGVIAPTFEVIHKGLKVVIFKEKINNELNEPLNEPLNERQKLLFEMLKNNKNTTRNELAIECKVSLNTIKRDLVLHQKLHLISREGSDKTGHWKILK